MIIYYISAEDDAAQSDARSWIKRHGLTPDDARLVRKDGAVMVIDKGTAFDKLNKENE